jgi:hypothetical protein
LDRRLGGPQDAVEKRKISCPCRESNPGRPAHRYTGSKIRYTELSSHRIILTVVLDGCESGADFLIEGKSLRVFVIRGICGSKRK